MLACPRKYAFKYVLGIPESSSKALGIGKAFHEVLEGKNLNASEHGLDEREAGVVKKMAANHAFVTRHLPKVTHKELKFETQTVLGFLDAIRVREDGHTWSIAERKTAGDLSKLETVRRELQLCTYAASVETIAETAKLDPTKFDGFHYEITLKPSERPRMSESADQFVDRCTVYTEVTKVEASEREGMQKHFERQYHFGRMLKDIAHENLDRYDDPLSVPCNQNSCKLFNQKCAYFNQCYGEKS